MVNRLCSTNLSGAVVKVEGDRHLIVLVKSRGLHHLRSKHHLVVLHDVEFADGVLNCRDVALQHSEPIR